MIKLSDICAKLKGIVRMVGLSSINDSDEFRRAQMITLNNEQGQIVEVFIPYGTFGKEPEDCMGIALAKRSNSSETIAIGSDPKRRIIKDCAEGEYGVGNYLTQAYLYFKEDGSIELLSKDSFNVNADADIIITPGPTNKIGLATDGLNPLHGVVTGECLDPITGLPFPDKSTIVFAKKV